jgi:hypothetical protein
MGRSENETGTETDAYSAVVSDKSHITSESKLVLV